MKRLPADPADWNTYLAEGNAKQARKRVASKVIFREGSGRILLVEPTYKPAWDLPGGMAEANEPPLDAARREVREELRLDVVRNDLLVVDWASPHGPWDDELVFLFNGGVIAPEQVAELRPIDDELAGLGFFTADDASVLLLPHVWRRVEFALRALAGERVHYLQDGYLSQDPSSP